MSTFDWKKTIEEEETFKKEESDEEDAGNFEYKKKNIKRVYITVYRTVYRSLPLSGKH